MFTTRAEFRLYLRPDNADLRLTKKGYEIGCVSEERFRKAEKIRETLEEVVSLLKSEVKSMRIWKKMLNCENTGIHEKRFKVLYEIQ